MSKIKIFIASVMTLCLLILIFYPMKKDNEVTMSEHEFVYKSIKIEYGDTLWSIAEEYSDKKDDISVDLAVERILYVNGLKNSRIVAGNYIIVPVSKEMLVSSEK